MGAVGVAAGWGTMSGGRSAKVIGRLVAHQSQAFYHVAEFADVAGPVVVAEGFQDGGVELLGRPDRGGGTAGR